MFCKEYVWYGCSVLFLAFAISIYVVLSCDLLLIVSCRYCKYLFVELLIIVIIAIKLQLQV